MKHTSINLSDEHLGLIARTGKSPTTVIREALDKYFEPTPSAMDLIREHERQYHMPALAHKERIEQAEASQYISETMPIIARNSRMNMPKIEHEMRMQILTYILEELKAGREPLLPDVAAKFNIDKQSLAKSLSPLGIRAQETKRKGKAGRYFTRAMQSQIEDAIGCSR